MPSVASQKHAKRAYCGLISTFYAAFFEAKFRRGLQAQILPMTGRVAFESTASNTKSSRRLEPNLGAARREQVASEQRSGRR